MSRLQDWKELFAGIIHYHFEGTNNFWVYFCYVLRDIRQIATVLKSIMCRNTRSFFDNTSVLFGRCTYRVFNNLEFEIYHINWEMLSTGKILLCSCQKRLGEKKSWYPEDHRRSIRDPVLEEGDSVEEISYIISQRLSRRVWLGRPHHRNFPIHKISPQELQVATHYN